LLPQLLQHPLQLPQAGLRQLVEALLGQELVVAVALKK
jgi:hypothetical protein